ncbi:hypothetical protein [Paenibacillus sp. SN-8-1]|uniref:hypothetical protein n=1 Tax=Paenibacillus sp. SN-8-1 TaxID=3435409 RepID=UPI003D9A65B7
MKIDSNCYHSMELAQAKTYTSPNTSSVKWRVGTVPMGISLLILGMVILFSDLYGYNGFTAAKAWWPIYFILLGLEIMAHSIFRRNVRIQYDVISIFLIGVLSVCSQVYLFLLGH